MKIVHTLQDLHRALSPERSRVLVPTMGNLHEGHLRLIDTAKRHGEVVIASIFVNRLQFAPHEDFDRYPRTLERDCEQLAARGCDLVFAPNEQELYPLRKPSRSTRIPHWPTCWKDSSDLGFSSACAR